MTEGILVNDGNLDNAIHLLKKVLQRDGLFEELKERAAGHKASDRRKLKQRKAETRRKKKNFRVQAAMVRQEANTKGPSWKFVRNEGETIKVQVKKREMYQAKLLE